MNLVLKPVEIVVSTLGTECGKTFVSFSINRACNHQYNEAPSTK